MYLGYLIQNTVVALAPSTTCDCEFDAQKSKRWQRSSVRYRFRYLDRGQDVGNAASTEHLVNLLDRRAVHGARGCAPQGQGRFVVSVLASRHWRKSTARTTPVFRTAVGSSMSPSRDHVPPRFLPASGRAVRASTRGAWRLRRQAKREEKKIGRCAPIC